MNSHMKIQRSNLEIKYIYINQKLLLYADPIIMTENEIDSNLFRDNDN